MGFRLLTTLYSFFLIGKCFCISPPKNFRFNCIYDICTFPIQYCDLEDERCHYCNDDICRSEKIPEQCQFKCGDQSNTDQTTQVLTHSSPRTGNLHSKCPDQSIELSNIVILVVVIAVIAVSALLLAVFTLLYFICRKSRKAQQYHTTCHKRTLFNYAINDGANNPLLVNSKKGNEDTESGQSVSISQNGTSQQPTAPPREPNIDLEDETTNGQNITQPSTLESESRHHNINDQNLLNFGEPSTTETQDLTLNDIQPEKDPNDTDGRHSNINDNELFHSKPTATSLSSKPPTALVFPERGGFSHRTNGPISSPTEEGKPDQHDNVSNVNMLKGLGQSDSGFDVDDDRRNSMTDLKDEFVAVVT